MISGKRLTVFGVIRSPTPGSWYHPGCLESTPDLQVPTREAGSRVLGPDPQVPPYLWFNQCVCSHMLTTNMLCPMTFIHYLSSTALCPMHILLPFYDAIDILLINFCKLPHLSHVSPDP